MIKKIFLFSLLLAFATGTTAYANDSINICINDADVKFIDNRPFIDENGRTLVPFRTVLESFGADVNWDSENNTAVAVKGDIIVKVPVGESYILKNNELVENDTQAVNKNGYVFLPIRVVLESFGADVNWDSNSRTVHITTTTETKDIEDTFSSVKFNNPVIEEIIREKLHLENNESITKSKLKTIHKFICADKNLKDISDLANLTELTTLELRRCQITDINALSNLRSLTELYLSENQINNISPLASLKNLESLELYTNNIVSIEALTGLNKLTQLSLSHNKISDISPLAQCLSLESISIGNNNVTDISPLNSLFKLTDLRADNNKISDISCISNWNNIEVFMIQNNQVTDLTPLAKHMEVESIRVTGNIDTDFSKFKNHKILKFTDFEFHTAPPND